MYMVSHKLTLKCCRPSCSGKTRQTRYTAPAQLVVVAEAEMAEFEVMAVYLVVPVTPSEGEEAM